MPQSILYVEYARVLWSYTCTLLLLLLLGRVRLCDPTDGSPPGSSVHGVFQARVPEWAALAFSDMHTSAV